MGRIEAKRGDTVHVHYEGTLDDGTVFDSSEGGDPISFTIGEGDVIPGFEAAVEGMAAGEKKKEHIVADQAYGERRDELIFSVSREQIPPDTELEVGDTLKIGFPDGSSAIVQVTALEGDNVTLDANHPLAGKNLNFDLELVRVDQG
jgi:FKBP-type peptidyl-prolyl cis-trans isomerase 2